MNALVRSLLLFCIFCLTQVKTAQTAETSPLSPVIMQMLNESGDYGCLSVDEKDLFDRLNDYRKMNGLTPIPNARSLNMVARIHAYDIATNRPEEGCDEFGRLCNLHSWSAQGFWSPVCYTGDRRQLAGVIRKPSEITNRVYCDAGYENVYWTSAEVIFPYRVVDAWQKSPEHDSLILEKDRWEGSNWQALGVGIYRNVVTIWVGEMPDPLGPLKDCPKH